MLFRSGGKAGAASEKVGGLTLTAQIMSGVSGKDLPPMIDEMKNSGWAGIVVLAAASDEKAAVAVGVSETATAAVSAVDVLRAVVGALGGKGGGGRADLAQGGAPSLDNWDSAMDAARAVIQTAVGRA